MKIAILGAGNMGAWLALTLAEDHEVGIYDIDSTRYAAMEGKKTIHTFLAPAALGEYRPNLLLNAVSLKNTVEAFESALPHVEESCLLADVTSIKGNLPAFYRGTSRRWVSVHPMFGPTFANLKALSRENAVIIKESADEGKAFFESFFKNLGVTIFYYHADEHDRMMAYSLTTPFVATLVFAACMTEDAVPGTTFARHREIARGLLGEDDQLLAEILFNDLSLSQIEQITNRLEFLKHIIRGRDGDEAVKFFAGLRKNIGGPLQETPSPQEDAIKA
ncbi:MAG: prephenate dehydrogenase/arogenate dehydrogenase family protein [Candidatus Eremiobacteraeota bacterium]|nr:prephenate dehydrogenase/arogenate dehydrogenase family protein [Candidatus Eremiobacteraeota bacterium]